MMQLDRPNGYIFSVVWRNQNLTKKLQMKKEKVNVENKSFH